MAFASGTIGSITVSTIHGEADLGLKEWTCNVQTNVIPTNTFLSAFQVTTFGITKADVSGSGPWSDTDALQDMATGLIYTVTLGLTGAISFAVDVRISNWEIKDDAEGNPMFSFTGTSDGVFSPVFV